MAHKPEHTPYAGDIHPLAKPFLFLGSDKFVKNFVWFILAGLIVTIILGFVYPFDSHHKAPWDFVISWALIGGLSYAFLVFCANPLFKLLSRPEDYYGEGGDDD